MTRRLSAGLLALIAALICAAPAAAQSRREMQMMADIRMLQEQTQQMQQQLQAALDAISAQLKAISTRVDDQAGATRKSFADQKLAVDQFGSDLRIVRERIDESNVRILLATDAAAEGRDHSRHAVAAELHAVLVHANEQGRAG